jgi:ERCC4-related helicase
MVEMHLGSGIHWQEADEGLEQREQSQILKEFLDGEQFVPVETESRGRVLS